VSLDPLHIEKLFAIVKCPYCGFENRYCFKIDNYQTSLIVHCHKEFNGCGKPFVIALPFEIKLPCQAYKIGDEGIIKIL